MLNAFRRDDGVIRHFWGSGAASSQRPIPGRIIAAWRHLWQRTHSTDRPRLHVYLSKLVRENVAQRKFKDLRGCHMMTLFQTDNRRRASPAPSQRVRAHRLC